MKIILIRHGRPENAHSAKLNSAGFANWVKNYDHSLVAEDSHPNYQQLESYKQYYAVSSDLPRAIHSCKLVFQRQPDHQSALFREMEIPRYRLPFKLKAWHWVYVNRLLWMCGKRGPFESYCEAKQRAKQAAEQLIALANTHGNVVLFSHGFLNLHMRKHLRTNGFLQHSKASDYWGVSVFEQVRP